MCQHKNHQLLKIPALTNLNILFAVAEKKEISGNKFNNEYTRYL